MACVCRADLEQQPELQLMGLLNFKIQIFYSTQTDLPPSPVTVASGCLLDTVRSIDSNSIEKSK